MTITVQELMDRLELSADSHYLVKIQSKGTVFDAYSIQVDDSTGTAIISVREYEDEE